MTDQTLLDIFQIFPKFFLIGFKFLNRLHHAVFPYSEFGNFDLEYIFLCPVGCAFYEYLFICNRMSCLTFIYSMFWMHGILHMHLPILHVDYKIWPLLIFIFSFGISRIKCAITANWKSPKKCWLIFVHFHLLPELGNFHGSHSLFAHCFLWLFTQPLDQVFI